MLQRWRPGGYMGDETMEAERNQDNLELIIEICDELLTIVFTVKRAYEVGMWKREGNAYLFQSFLLLATLLEADDGTPAGDGLEDVKRYSAQVIRTLQQLRIELCAQWDEPID